MGQLSQYTVECCYCSCPRGWRAFSVALCILTGGLLWIAQKLLPSLRLFLWYSLCDCEDVISVILIKIHDGNNLGKRCICEVQSRIPDDSKRPAEIVVVERQRFLYDRMSGQLAPTSKLPATQLQAHLTDAAQAVSHGHAPQPLPHASRDEMFFLHGDNSVHMDQPHWAWALGLCLVQPLHLLQLLAAAIWIYYGYDEFAGIVIALTSASVIIAVAVTHQASIRVRQAAESKVRMQVIAHASRISGADRGACDENHKRGIDEGSCKGKWQVVCQPSRAGKQPAIASAPLITDRNGTHGDHMSTGPDHLLATGHGLEVGLDVVLATGMAWVEERAVSELVVGDVVIVTTTHIAADMVLLQGECVVDESTLTGENHPLHRCALCKPLPSQWDNLPPNNCLRKGAIILANSGTATVPVLAMVTKTGFDTTKGQLMREMAHTKQILPFVQAQAAALLTILSLMGVAFYAWDVASFHRLGLGAEDMGMLVLEVVTVAVPPALVTCVMLTITCALLRLGRLHVHIKDARHVPLAGMVDTVCLDKTGTITAPKTCFQHIVPVSGGHVGSVLRETGQAPLEFKVLMATCHGLVLLGDQAKGHPIDLAMYQAGGWTLYQEGMTPVTGQPPADDMQVRLSEDASEVDRHPMTKSKAPKDDWQLLGGPSEAGFCPDNADSSLIQAAPASGPLPSGGDSHAQATQEATTNALQLLRRSVIAKANADLNGPLRQGVEFPHGGIALDTADGEGSQTALQVSTREATRRALFNIDSSDPDVKASHGPASNPKSRRVMFRTESSLADSAGTLRNVLDISGLSGALTVSRNVIENTTGEFLQAEGACVGAFLPIPEAVVCAQFNVAGNSDAASDSQQQEQPTHVQPARFNSAEKAAVPGWGGLEGKAKRPARFSLDPNTRESASRIVESQAGQDPDQQALDAAKLLSREKSRKFAQAHMAFVTREHMLAPGLQLPGPDHMATAAAQQRMRAQRSRSFAGNQVEDEGQDSGLEEALTSIAGQSLDTHRSMFGTLRTCTTLSTEHGVPESATATPAAASAAFDYNSSLYQACMRSGRFGAQSPTIQGPDHLPELPLAASAMSTQFSDPLVALMSPKVRDLLAPMFTSSGGSSSALVSAKGSGWSTSNGSIRVQQHSEAGAHSHDRSTGAIADLRARCQPHSDMGASMPPSRLHVAVRSAWRRLTTGMRTHNAIDLPPSLIFSGNRRQSLCGPGSTLALHSITGSDNSSVRPSHDFGSRRRSICGPGGLLDTGASGVRPSIDYASRRRSLCAPGGLLDSSGSAAKGASARAGNFPSDDAARRRSMCMPPTGGNSARRSMDYGACLAGAACTPISGAGQSYDYAARRRSLCGPGALPTSRLGDATRAVGNGGTGVGKVGDGCWEGVERITPSKRMSMQLNRGPSSVSQATNRAVPFPLLPPSPGNPFVRRINENQFSLVPVAKEHDDNTSPNNPGNPSWFQSGGDAFMLGLPPEATSINCLNDLAPHHASTAFSMAPSPDAKRNLKSVGNSSSPAQPGSSRSPAAVPTPDSNSILNSTQYSQLIRELAGQKSSAARLPGNIQISSALALGDDNKDVEEQEEEDDVSGFLPDVFSAQSATASKARSPAKLQSPAAVVATATMNSGFESAREAAQLAQTTTGSVASVAAGGAATGAGGCGDTGEAYRAIEAPTTVIAANGANGVAPASSGLGIGLRPETLPRPPMLGRKARRCSDMGLAALTGFARISEKQADNGSGFGNFMRASPAPLASLAKDEVRTSATGRTVSRKNSRLTNGGEFNRSSQSTTVATRTSSHGLWARLSSLGLSRRFEAAELRPASYKVTQLWAHPGPDVPAHFRFTVVHRYPFTSTEMRCSVVVDQPGGNLVLYIKGAPEKIFDMCDPSSLPPDIHAHVAAAQKPGCIVLAAACKVLADVRPEHLPLFTRSALESNAEFLGLVVLSNQVRGNSVEVLKEIQAGGMTPIIVTGDSVRSGVHVAQQVGMIPGNNSMLIIDHQGGTGVTTERRASVGGFPTSSSRLHLSVSQGSGALQTERGPSMPGYAALAVARGSGDAKSGSVADLAHLGGGSWAEAGLTFRLVNGGGSQNLDAAQATKMLHKFKIRCAVSGPAWAVLTSCPAQAPLLGLVLRHGVVYGRMQPHMKHELVELLGHPPRHHVSWLERFLGAPLYRAACHVLYLMSRCVRRLFDRQGVKSKTREKQQAVCSQPLGWKTTMLLMEQGQLTQGSGSQSQLHMPMDTDNASGNARKGLHLGKNVAYCGDGANDLGALKAALVGVGIAGKAGSLATSIAIPGSGGLQGLRELLAQGRACLGNLKTVIQFMIVYAFIQLCCQGHLFRMGLNMGLYQYLLQDFFYAMLTAAIMGFTPAAPRLTPERPFLTVFSMRLLLPVAVHCGIATATLSGALALLNNETWFEALGDPVKPGNSPLMDGAYSVTRPESGVVMVVGLALLLGTGTCLNLASSQVKRQRVLRNQPLILLWLAQGGFLLYLIWAPGDDFKRYGPRGPGVADMPLEFRARLGGLLMGVVTVQQLIQVLLVMAMNRWLRA